MTDLGKILSLWQELRESGTEYVLATVVAVEGSGYRKPGARMLIAADGRKRGTISGGCLEGEVARKAFWHTENGPVVRRYSTSAEDGEVPFGMGCGGVVHLLLERSATADPMLDRLSAAFVARVSLAIATVLEGEWIGRRQYWPAANHIEGDAAVDGLDRELAFAALQGYEDKRSFAHTIHLGDGSVALAQAEWLSPRQSLHVFGAGDDAIPLTRLARELGWYVTVSDGRSHLATRTRFPDVDEVLVLSKGKTRETARRRLLPTDAAAVMTHSLEQDTNILRSLLSADVAYIGVLGPRRRTAEILASLAEEIASGAGPEFRPKSGEGSGLTEQWMQRIHAPMGLDLGAETPADIALSIVAEIQLALRRGTGLPLRQVQAWVRPAIEDGIPSSGYSRADAD